MSLSSRFWRIVKGRYGSKQELDPDELLGEYQRLRREAAAARASGGGQREQKTTAGEHFQDADRVFLQACARLEIDASASKSEAKKAWRRLMKKYHPDQHQNNDRKRELATELTASLTEAYEIVIERL